MGRHDIRGDGAVGGTPENFSADEIGIAGKRGISFILAAGALFIGILTITTFPFTTLPIDVLAFPLLSLGGVSCCWSRYGCYCWQSCCKSSQRWGGQPFKPQAVRITLPNPSVEYFIKLRRDSFDMFSSS